MRFRAISTLGRTALVGLVLAAGCGIGNTTMATVSNGGLAGGQVDPGIGTAINSPNPGDDGGSPAPPLPLGPNVPDGGQPGAVVHAWITVGDSNNALIAAADGQLKLGVGDPTGAVAIDIDPTAGHQRIDGFGATYSDTSARLMAGYARGGMGGKLYASFFTLTSGIGLNMVHISLGAGEFSSNGDYNYDQNGGAADPNLTNINNYFDGKYILSNLLGMHGYNPNMLILATTWSGPAWMKTNNSMVGGSLMTQYRPTLANYIAYAVNLYRQNGTPIYALAAQNDPEVSGDANGLAYPSSLMSAADEASFLVENLEPAVHAVDPNLRLITYEGAWSNPNRPLTVHGDRRAGPLLSGTAFHCDSGDASAQNLLRTAYPSRSIWLTQCGAHQGHAFSDDLIWYARDIFIGSLRNEGNAVMLYNFALDQNDGPFQPHTTVRGCMHCRGLVTINNYVSPNTVTYNLEYYILGHFSKFIRSGAVRIDSSGGAEQGISHVAVKNPDGSIVVVVVNANATQATTALHLGAASSVYTLAPLSVVTFVIPSPS